MARRKNEENAIQRIRLSRKQLKEMIAKEKGVLEPLFSKKYLNDTYMLPNGQVVVDFDTHGLLYSSFTDLKNWIRQLRKMQDEELPSHILKNRLLYGEEFLLHVPGLLEIVVDVFKLKDSTPTIDQLKIIDQQLMEKRTEITPAVFSGLVAYAGEIIKKSLNNAEWAIVTSAFDTAVCEPFVIEGETTYNPFFPVYRELFEQYPETNRLSLADAVHIEMKR